MPTPLIVAFDTDPARAVVAMVATMARRARTSHGDFAVLKVMREKQLGHIAQATQWLLNFLYRGAKGKTVHFFGIVMITPPSQVVPDWSIFLIRVFVAPADRFPALVPTFAAVMKSLKLDMTVIQREQRQQTAQNNRMFQANQAAVAQNNRIFEANLRANQQAFQQSFAQREAGILHQQDASHAAARAFIRTIQGTTVVADPATGKHYVAPASVAGALARQDPSNFQIVPLSQYIKGTDY